MADYQAPVWLMVCLQILFLALVLVVYRYLVYFSENQKAYANGFLIFCLAGIICSFIDVVFWGGSLDFIRLLDWFTFDLKDVYLTVCIACVLPYAFSYLRTYRNTTAEERKEQGLWRWIKKGCPVSRSGLSDKPHEN